MLDFSQAPQQRDMDTLIPHGTLAWGVLKIRPANLDQGQIAVVSKNNSDNAYLDCEITIEGGQWDKKKVWTRIGVKGSEGYVNMGGAAIRAILEVGNGASPQNMAGYQIADYMRLNGLKVAIRVKEDHQQGYAAKNDVSLWLTPHDEAAAKEFTRLQAGDTAPNPNMRKPVIKADVAAPAATAPAWGAPATGAATLAGPAVPVSQTAPVSPPWLQQPPSAAK